MASKEDNAPWTHRAETPIYAIDRIYATVRHDPDRLGKVMEKLMRRIEKRFGTFSNNSRGTGLFVRKFDVAHGIKSAEDFATALVSHLQKNGYKRLATYDELLRYTDFRRSTRAKHCFAKYARVTQMSYRRML